MITINREFVLIRPNGQEQFLSKSEAITLMNFDVVKPLSVKDTTTVLMPDGSFTRTTVLTLRKRIY